MMPRAGKGQRLRDLRQGRRDAGACVWCSEPADGAMSLCQLCRERADRLIHATELDAERYRLTEEQDRAVLTALWASAEEDDFG